MKRKSVHVIDMHIMILSGTKVASGPGHSKRIFVAEFRPDSDTTFVTCGVKHATWWTVAGATLVGKKANVASYQAGSATKMQTMLSVAFGPVSLLMLGLK